MKEKELIEEFPFLSNILMSNDEEGDVGLEDLMIEEVPKGWNRLVLAMCKELKQALVKAGQLEEYKVLQAKEKYGSLRWHEDKAYDCTKDIIKKYYQISKNTCAWCGKPATRTTRGWVCPICEDCFNKI